MDVVDYQFLKLLFRKSPGETSQEQQQRDNQMMRQLADLIAVAPALPGIIGVAQRILDLIRDARPDPDGSRVTVQEDAFEQLPAFVDARARVKSDFWDIFILGIIAAAISALERPDPDVFARLTTDAWVAGACNKEIAQFEALKAQELLVEEGLTVSEGRLRELNAEYSGQIDSARNWLVMVGTEITERQQSLVKLSQDTQSAIDNVNTLTRDTDERLKMMNAAAEDLVTRWRRLSDQTDLNEQAVQSFISSLREQASQSEASTFWRDRARASAYGFWGSLAVLVLLLAVIPLFGLYYHSNILSYIRDVGNAIATEMPKAVAGQEIASSAQYTQAILATAGRLIVIAAPAALYFWLIRIIVRYNMHALVLMNDARQRMTIMDTYVHLHAKNIALPEDRAVMFGAVFRPLPGQPNDVEPPNLVDIYRLKDTN